MSKPVCHINMNTTYRGSERQTELLIRGIAKWGVAQRVVAPDGSQLLTNLGEVGNIERIGVGHSRNAAARACKGSRFVHAHDWLSVEAAHRANFFSRVPFMVTQRTESLPASTWLNRRRLNKARAVVAISRAVRAALVAHSPTLNPVVVNSCASVHRVFATTSEILRSKYRERFVVGHIGALDDAHKGQSDLIEVARVIARTHPDVLFMFIGAGPDESAFRQQASGMSNVEFVGLVNNLGDYLRLMDVFAFPSRAEGLGATLLDAMDYSLPIVATAVGGIPELVRDGVNGLLVSPGNVDQLAFAIQRLHGDERLRRRLGTAGNERVQKYTPDAMVEAYLELYQEHMPAR